MVVDGKQLTIRSENPLFNRAIDEFRAHNWEKLYDTLTPEVAIKRTFAKFGDIEVIDGQVTYRGREVHNIVVDRILTFIEYDFDVLPLVKFLHKLMKNPSGRSVSELYNFLERNELTLTDEGNFLGYKAVDSNWYSISSGKAHLIKGKELNGKIYNGIGEEIEVERNSVNDDANVGCSYGLHVGTLDYATQFGRGGGHLLIVEVDPSYVVSVPHDCNCTKLRTAAYKVISECEGKLREEVYHSTYSHDSYWDAWDDVTEDDDEYLVDEEEEEFTF